MEAKDQFVMGEFLIFTNSVLIARQIYEKLIEMSNAQREAQIELDFGIVVRWKRLAAGQRN